MLPFNLFPLTTLIYLSLLFISFVSWVSEQAVNPMRVETMPSKWRAEFLAQVSEGWETKRTQGGWRKETHDWGPEERRKHWVQRREGRERRVWPGEVNSGCGARV